MIEDLELSAADIARFHSFVGLPGDCREWTGARHKQGYGLFSWWVRTADGGRRTRTIRAHRLAYWLAAGRPVGMVCHDCDNPPCCDPGHLYDGTAATNKADQVRRARHAHGERVNTAKLTADQVIEIRARHALGGVTYEDLGREYGVTGAMVSNIVRGNSWRHLLPVAG